MVGIVLCRDEEEKRRTHDEAVFVTADERARLNDMLGRMRFRAEEPMR
jgi:hypothetical protein